MSVFVTKGLKTPSSLWTPNESTQSTTYKAEVVLVRSFTALVKHHDQNQPGQDSGRGVFCLSVLLFCFAFWFFGFFWLSTFRSHSITEGGQGRKSRWTPARKRERKPWGTLLTGSVPTVCSARFLILSKTTNKAGSCTTPSELGPPTLIIDPVSDLQPCLQASLIERLSQICLGLWLVDKSQWTCGMVIWNSSMYSPKGLMISVRFPG